MTTQVDQDGEEVVIEETRPWVLAQKKTFTKIINRYFKDPKDQVQDLSKDFRDGKKLLTFLGYVLSMPTPKPERGSLQIHFINNVKVAIDIMKNNGVKIYQIAAEEIVKGDLKMTLAMIWAIILRGFVESIQEGNARASEGLLLWCQRKTAGYRDVNVLNLHSSWRDGMAFNALIHAHRPDLVDYDSLKPENPRENLQLAFDTAQKHFKIDPIIEVDDMIGEGSAPDERCVTAYLSYFYHYFSKFNSIEQAAKKLEKIMDMNESNLKSIENYETSGSDLLKWMNSKIPWLKDRCGDAPSLDDVRSKYDDLNGFRKDEKPPRSDQKTKLESDYQSIQTILNLQSRPPYIPPDELNTRYLDDKWKVMEQEEEELARWLDEMLKMLQKVEYLFTRFFYKCNRQEQWGNAIKSSFNSSSLSIDIGLSELLGREKQLQTVESEIHSRDQRITHITALKDQLQASKSSRIGEVLSRYEEIMTQWSDIDRSYKEYQETLRATISKAMDLEEHRVKYATSSARFRNWLDDCLEDYGDDYKPRELSEIEEWLKSHESFVKNLPASLSELQNLIAVSNQVKALTSLPNPYSTITIQQLEEKIQTLKSFCDKRTSMLKEEQDKLQLSEKMRTDFDKKVIELEKWREEFTSRISAILIDRAGTIENRRSQLTVLLKEIETYQAEKFTSLDDLSSNMKSNHVLHWENSANKAIATRALFSSTIRSIHSSISEMENQIAIRDSSLLTPKEVDDIKRTFNTICKRQHNALDHSEFLNCLVSLGFSLNMEDENDPVFKKILETVDPLNTNSIPLSAVQTFLSSQKKDADSADKIAQIFKEIANGKDYIMPDEIRQYIAPKHAQTCLSRMQPYTGSDAPAGALDYSSFADSIFGESDL